MNIHTCALIPFFSIVVAGWIGAGLPGVRRWLARRVEERPALALAPAGCLIAALVLARLVDWRLDAAMILKAAAYWIAPLLLAGIGRRDAAAVTWRDYAAAAAFFLPVHLHWFGKPGPLLVEAIPAASVPLAIFYLVSVRGFRDPGFSWQWTWTDARIGLRAFVVFGALAIPVALGLGFVQLHTGWSPVERFPLTFLIVLVAIAIPEELLFRGFLQTGLEQTLGNRWRALLLASLLFGASHWNHFPPLPNWRYVLLAGMAGIAYGLAYRAQRRLPAAALTHALVDTTWFLFLMKGAHGGH